MKKYSTITVKFGTQTIIFTNGIIEFSDKETLDIHVEKNSRNLNALLEAGIRFYAVEKSYRFNVVWTTLFSVNI